MSKKQNKNNNTAKKNDDSLIRLNKFLSQNGILSRREADSYIALGRIKVSGKIVKQGHKIKLNEKTTNEKRKGCLIQLRYIHRRHKFLCEKKILRYFFSSPFVLFYFILFFLCYNRKPFSFWIRNPAGKTASVF